MCNRTYKYEFDPDISFFEDESVTIELLSVTPKGATVFITDNSEYGYSFGYLNYKLQKKQINGWKYLRSKFKYNIVPAAGLGRDDNNEYRVDCEWDKYGKLSSGTYRMIIAALNPEGPGSVYFCSDEFVIE